MQDKLIKFVYLLLISFSISNCLSLKQAQSPNKLIYSQENEIIIKITKENNKNGIRAGWEGTLYFVTDYNNNERHIFNETEMGKENIKFNANISDVYNNVYKANCRFWQPSDDNARIFCKFGFGLNYANQNITFNEFSFDYNEYKIIIKQDDYIEAVRIPHHIPFLYSDKFEKETFLINPIWKFTFKFQIESYNNEELFIYGQTDNNYAILDNCKVDENDNKVLTCEKSYTNISTIFTYKAEHFKVGAIREDAGIVPFDCILDISIIDTGIGHITHYIGITKLINTITEVGGYCGYETNITGSSELISGYMDGIFENCFFKYRNSRGRLLILCKVEQENEKLLPKYSGKELVYENIHCVYIFRIQPFDISGNFKIKGAGTDVKLIIPEKLDFSNNDTLVVKYIMTNPLSAKNIKFNPEVSDLECKDLIGLKICIVTKEHFMRNSTGKYYTLHSNHELSLTQYLEAEKIDVILPKEELIEINIFINDIDNTRKINLAKNGIVYFLTNYSCTKDNIFNSSDVEEQSEFKTTITDENLINYNVTCKLWIAVNDKVRIFCKLEQDINDDINIKINSATFTFNNYRIYLISEMTFSINLIKVNTSVPFIYNNVQNIDIDNTKDTYDIRLRYLEYNNEKLILSKKKEESFYILLDECNFEKNDIKCKINRDKIEEILGYDGEIFELNYFDNNLGQLIYLENVFNIRINYKSIKKENVYIGINNLLINNIENNSYIAYETNITNINNLISNKFILNQSDSTQMPCLLKKDINQKLLLICKMTNIGTFTLGEIKQELILDYINIKYNLLIQPVLNNDKFIVDGNGGSILFASPMILDFYENDSLTIYFYSNDIEYINEIRLNPDSDEDIKCDTINKMKKCIITKSYFNGKQNGYYYLYYKNNFENYTKFFQLSPINVILPKDKELIIKINNIDNNHTLEISQKGAISFITEYEDSQNIFNTNYIKQNTLCNATFTGIDKIYKAECHLWKPKGEKMRLICKFEENINSQNIQLNKYNFDYNGYKITVLFLDYLAIKQLNFSKSYLYADKQEINLNDNNKEYILKFKKEIYNKELLILYKDFETMKYIYLNCKEEEKEISCTINRDKLIEILSYSGEKFYLSQLTDSQGISHLNDVFEITIIYPSIKKQDIYINITKLIDMADSKVSFIVPSIENNTYAVFETNVTNMHKISTNYFKITTKYNNNLSCFLKKNNEQNGDKLYLFCDADYHTNYGIYQFTIIGKNEINNAHILYNFILLPNSKNYQGYIFGKKGTKVFSVYPEILDFTSKDNLTIKIQTEKPELLELIKLNNDSSSQLDCINKIGIKECVVPKNHFTKSGYYNVYHNNSFAKMMIIYEIPKINVLLEGGDSGGSSSAGLIVGIIIAVLVVVGVVIFIIIRYKRKNSDNPSSSEKVESTLKNRLE